MLSARLSSPLFSLLSLFFPMRTYATAGVWILLLAIVQAVQAAKWQIALDGLPTTTTPSFPLQAGYTAVPLLVHSSSVPNATASTIRLIDWRDWLRMRRGNTSAVTSTNSTSSMLIVAADNVDEQGPAEALEVEEREMDHDTTTTDTTIHISDSPATGSVSPTLLTLSPTTAPFLSSSMPPSTAPSYSLAISSNTSSANLLSEIGDAKDRLNIFSNTPNPLLATEPSALDFRGVSLLAALLKQLSVLPSMLRSIGHGGEGGEIPLRSAASFPSFPLLAAHQRDDHSLIRSEKEESDDQPPLLFSSKSTTNRKLLSNEQQQQDRLPPLGWIDTDKGLLPQLEPIVPVITTELGMVRNGVVLPAKKSPPRGPLNMDEEEARLESATSTEHYSPLPLPTPMNGLKSNVYGLSGRKGHTRIHKERPTEGRVSPTRKLRPRFDFSALTEDELQQLELIHHKLVNGENGDNSRKLDGREEVEISNPDALSTQASYKDVDAASLPISQKFKSTTATPMVAPPMTAEGYPANLFPLVGVDADVLQQLEAVRKLPDFNELVKGMDLSLIGKPGGLAILKQQFIERFLKRRFGGLTVSSGGGSGSMPSVSKRRLKDDAIRHISARKVGIA